LTLDIKYAAYIRNTYLYIVLNLCRVGDKLITFLLRDCALYVPIGINDNYYQVTGAAIKMLTVMLLLCAEFAML